MNVNQILAKLTEATTDALFNLPALVTAKSWSKVAPAYLYSFEYSGEAKTRGSAFLAGLPLVSNDASNKGKVAHGDELIYLFDARDIHGASLQHQDVTFRNAVFFLDIFSRIESFYRLQLTNATDKKVRDIFSNLIAKFAYLNSNRGNKNQGNFQEYKDDDNNFMRIGPEVSNDKDFR